MFTDKKTNVIVLSALLLAIVPMVSLRSGQPQGLDQQQPIVLLDGGTRAGTSMVGHVQAQRAHLRRPTAMVFDQTDRYLLVANRESGSISVVDVKTASVVVEKTLGKSLVDVCRTHDQQFIAIDRQLHEMICFQWNASTKTLQGIWRRPVIRYPHRVVLIGPKKAAVFGLWSQQVEIVELENKKSVMRTIDLPFAPGAAIYSADHQTLIVAAKFTNQLMCIRTADGGRNWTLEQPNRIEGYSLRGLALSHDQSQLLISGQTLNALARSNRNDVHWGLMVANEIRTVSMQAVLRSRDKTLVAKVTALGKDEDGKADPGQMLLMRNGDRIVAIEGNGEIIRRSKLTRQFESIAIGRRPIDLVADSKQHWVAVANQLDDSISLVKLNDRLKPEVTTVPLGKQPELTSAQRGELAFFDGSLSHDSWMSCQSCHVDGHTNGLRNDNLSDQSFGAPKLVISSLGRQGTQPFAWNGSAGKLEQQIEKSIRQTMQSDQVPKAKTLRQLGDFLNSMAPPPPLVSARSRRGIVDAQRTRIKQGRELFEKLNCATCHQGKQLTSETLERVGLQDELGNDQFNPPSLLGVSQRPALLHDGRANSIHDLFARHRHQLEASVSDREIGLLVDYLRSL